jgi:hypothetical protein
MRLFAVILATVGTALAGIVLLIRYYFGLGGLVPIE